jgi:ABC-type multidrug transport system fused ATPase/permease subunit
VTPDTPRSAAEPANPGPPGGRRAARETARRARATWRVMYGYVRPHRLALLVGAVLSLVTGATGLALPLVVRALIGDLGRHRSVTLVLVLMTVLVVANAAVGAVGGYVLRRTAESVVLAARRRLVDRLLGLTIGSLDRSEPGDLMSRVTSDTTLLRDVTTDSLVGLVTGSLTLVATLVLMGLMDPVLLGVTLGVFSLAALVIGVVVPRIGRASRQAQDSVGLMGAALERMLGAFRTVKASSAEGREGARIHAAAREAWQADIRAAKWQAIAGNTAGLSIQCAFIAVLATGGARVASGAITVGTLVAFLLYVYYLMSPIQQLVSVATEYQVGAAAVARIQEAERLPVEPSAGPPAVGPAATAPAASAAAAASAPAGAPSLGTSSSGTASSRTAMSPAEDRAAGERVPATVTFARVRFRYRPELPEVHHGVSFTIPPRGMTAFVGPSGAGKTTVFSLIERFYEPDSGRILVDGRELRDWPIAELRADIGYVEQDAPVLSGTLAENLLLGAPGATDAQVAEVLRITRLAGLVARLPDGLATAVGHRGTRLSGGERQRVAIARALLRRPRLLLLDEATSQLDALNEAALRETVAETALLTTVLVVAHRLSTVTMADRIIVMDAGQVKAAGTHAELVASDPLYAELAATQFLASADTPVA